MTCSHSAQRGKHVMKSLDFLLCRRLRLGVEHMLASTIKKASAPPTNKSGLAQAMQKPTSSFNNLKVKTQNAKIETPTLRWRPKTPMKHMPLSQPLLAQAPASPGGVPDQGSWILVSRGQPCHAFRAQSPGLPRSHLLEGRDPRIPARSCNVRFLECRIPSLSPPTRRTSQHRSKKIQVLSTQARL
jgi:hypothetical protein